MKTENLHDKLNHLIKINKVSEFKKLFLISNNPNQEDSKGWTLLHLASLLNRIEIVEILLKNNADPNVICNQYENVLSPLHLSTMNGHEQVTRLLLQAGSIVDFQDVNGNSPLHLAARYEYLPIAVLLLEFIANINLKNHNQNTPLHVSSITKNIIIAEQLILNGCDLDSKNIFNKTPSDLFNSVEFNQIVTNNLIKRQLELLKKHIQITENNLSIEHDLVDREKFKLI